MLGRSKALFGLLSALAVVAPAAALAAIGISSNLAERDRARQNFFAYNQKEARFIAAAVDEEIARALDELALIGKEARPGETPDAERRVAPALVEYVFVIGGDGRVHWPPGARGGYARTRPESRVSAEGGFKAYLLALRAERRRQRQLTDGRAAESAGRAAEARRVFASLAGGQDDAAAQALLGLARLELAAGRADEAGRRYQELAARFAGARDEEGVGYALLAELGQTRARRDAGRELALYRGLVDGEFAAPPEALVALAADTRRRLDERPLGDGLRDELALIDARAEQARREAAWASAVEAEAQPLLFAATAEAEVRRAPGPGGRLWVFRRDGARVIGLALAPAALQAAAERALDGEIAAGNLPAGTAVRLSDAQVAIEATGFLAAERLRLLAPLSLSLWGDAGVADRSARAQLRRYLALVGGLILVMTVGMVATWRGAARERELARLKSDFVSTVSHELKTPLTSIRMFGEMLREGVAGSDVERERRYHDVIVRESERLGRLIANVLDFAQIEKGARRYDRRPVSAASLAEEAVSTYRRLADGEGQSIELEVEPGAEAATVLADREAMVQALLNLLSNASKYGGGAPVLVRVGVAGGGGGGEARLSVIDRGPGIAPADQKRIFREFYRAPEARRSGVEGTGLGLALVKRHVEAHGGRIDIDSVVGRGATFTIALPRASAGGEESVQP